MLDQWKLLGLNTGSSTSSVKRHHGHHPEDGGEGGAEADAQVAGYVEEVRGPTRVMIITVTGTGVPMLPSGHQAAPEGYLEQGGDVAGSQDHVDRADGNHPSQ